MSDHSSITQGRLAGDFSIYNEVKTTYWNSVLFHYRPELGDS